MTSSRDDTTQPDLLLDLAAGNISTFLATLGLNYSLLDGNQSSLLDGNQSSAVSRRIAQTSPGPLKESSDDSSIMTQIWLLLAVTALVLVLSYKFVLRLFLGHAVRKDDAVPDGFSDDDSAMVRQSMELDS